MRRREIPTWAVVVGVYTSWLLVTGYFHGLPLPVAVVLGGLVVAWHGSLQHETIHGHPTRSRRINALIASPPLGLWLPYGIYRRIHLAHHRTESIADPLHDPESFYVRADQYRRAGRLRRAMLWSLQTLAGRMLLGPPLTIAQLWWTQARRIAGGRFDHAIDWVWHAVGVAAVLAWVIAVCEIALWQYALAFVYPAVALTLLRSFAEHRAHTEPAHRTAIVETGPLLSLVFLNNNLHVVHHDEPRLPWFAYRRRYAERRDEILAANGNYRFAGYAQLAARYGLRPKDSPVHGE